MKPVAGVRIRDQFVSHAGLFYLVELVEVVRCGGYTILLLAARCTHCVVNILDGRLALNALHRTAEHVVVVARVARCEFDRGRHDLRRE